MFKCKLTVFPVSEGPRRFITFRMLTSFTRGLKKKNQKVLLFFFVSRFTGTIGFSSVMKTSTSNLFHPLNHWKEGNPPQNWNWEKTISFASPSFVTHVSYPHSVLPWTFIVSLSCLRYGKFYFLMKKWKDPRCTVRATQSCLTIFFFHISLHSEDSHRVNSFRLQWRLHLSFGR